MDLPAGVASQEALQGNLIARLPVQRRSFAGQEAVHPHASGTGDGEDPLLLRVQVYQLPPLQIGAVQGEGPLQAHLLVHGEHRFQGRMGQTAVRQNGQDHGHGDAVIPAQGGFLRPDPFPVGAEVQALLCHVLGAVLGLHADHVDVPLEDDGGRVLAAGAGVLPDDHVVHLVLPPAKAQFLGKAHAQVADLLGVAAAVGHGAQLFKVLEYRFRLQAG